MWNNFSDFSRVSHMPGKGSTAELHPQPASEWKDMLQCTWFNENFKKQVHMLRNIYISILYINGDHLWVVAHGWFTHITHPPCSCIPPASGLSEWQLMGRALLFAGPFLGFWHLFLFSTDSIAHFRNAEFHLQSVFLCLCKSNIAAYFAEGKGRRERKREGERGRGREGLQGADFQQCWPPVPHLPHGLHFRGLRGPPAQEGDLVSQWLDTQRQGQYK